MSLATEDKSCPVEGIGTLRFRVKYKGSFHEITLTDVLFNPKLRRNLLSGSRLESKGAHFVGTKEIWHQRFCHVNNDYLVKTSKNDSVKGLPRLTDNGETHCIPCKLAKSKRVSFKKTGAVRSKRPLELLHMDLCGPMPTESQGGNKYFLSIIDDYSRKVTVFPIRNKSDVFHTFIRFQKRAERFLSKKVIAVRTDGGLEFCNKDMDNFLTELGIKHEVTNSYTPEMNGVAERFNLTALDGIKTLLKSSEVPHKFWGEALLCFTYAWNRICHKDSNKTPFEKYSGRKPSVLHLIPFGCLAYAGVPKQIRKKFDMRAKMGIMMGYAQRTKGHRIWLIDENKLVETINGFSDLSEQQEALMVEVTIPNCYKQAIRSRDASKWHDAMDKEINVMKERKVWDLVDHPDNIKILENRWLYTIKYDENNKIVRYKARLVARVGIYRVSPNAIYKLGGNVENILRSHNYIGKHGRKSNPNEIKRHKDLKALIKNVV
ncbi:retrovirus-related Pol polyprotein from transposon TNT 1-94 [Trichonephila clavipes]|nr:retrovirus-related Pol polyprotein from transposon TNT 1-94 [Trichonephila clavipes]